MTTYRNNNNFQVSIGGKDYTNQTVYPIKWSKLLDERLDETRLSLKRLNRNIIHPLTPATVVMTDKRGREITLNTVVTTDNAAEVFVGSGQYNHEIMCLEETKILEGIVVDALTFRNDLGRVYANNPTTIYPDVSSNDFSVKTVDRLKSPQLIGETFVFPSLAEVFGLTTFIDSNEMIIEYNGTEIFSSTATNKVNGEKFPGQVTFTAVIEEGKYTLKYTVERKPIGDTLETTATYTLFGVKNRDPLPRWNIATVIDRVLDVAETHLKGVAPRFELNGKPKNGKPASGQYAAFEKIEAPEFAFTNSTLKEILDQIGGYIHGIPRLRGNTIYYDMLGGTEQAIIADPQYKYVSSLYSQDIESYCTSLDSSVDNLVCLTDPAQGTITEPANGGSKTLRTETVYARIEEGNMYIATQLPVQEIVGVENTYIPGKDFTAGNITPYIFESAEYERMSAYTDQYPNSKVYGLYYTQGKKNIYGFGFKQQTVASEIGDYAIIRILEAASGRKIGSLGKNYPALAFRVSYIPAFSARVQQTKQYIGEYKQPRALAYNQGANLIETRQYGENMKGAVARMGNVDRVVTYELADFSLIPEIGQMFGDDYYIAGVTCELQPNYIKCMLTLSQDFNRLSQYIGINTLRRFYEVSEKEAYRRNIKYADYIVIGDAVEPDETLADISPIHATLPQLATFRSVSCMIAEGYEENGEAVHDYQVLLPVVSTAQGNAMVFTASYEDNYSAGTQAQKVTQGAVTGYFTNAVPYANYYGRIDSLKFSMYDTLSSITEDQQLALPLWRGAESKLPLITTENNALNIKKDGSEILALNYILEFVTNRKNIVIGSAFARNCPLVRGVDTARQAKLYVLPKRLNKFAATVDLTGATEIPPVWTILIKEKKQFKLEDFTPKVDGVAWAIVDKSSNELLVGSNETITAGQVVSMPYMTLRHNIFNL